MPPADSTPKFWPVFFLIVSFGLLVAGLVAFVVVAVPKFWRRVRPSYQGLSAKIVLEVARLLSAIAAVGVKFTAPEDKLWYWDQLLGVVSYLTWALTSLVGEHRLRTESRARERLEAEVAFLEHLRCELRDAANEKRDRIRQVLAAGHAVTLVTAKKALDPDEHTQVLLEALVLFLRTPGHRTYVFGRHFRVALYVSGGVPPVRRLIPLYAYDSQTGSSALPPSFSAPAVWFELTTPGLKAAVVLCANQPAGDLLLISNCSAPAPGLAVIDGRQQSLIAYRIDPFGPTSAVGTIQQAVVVIDTDVAGCFTEEDRAQIERYVEEFAARLNLEAFIAGLVP